MKLTAPSRSWAEVNLDNIVHNYREFCRVTATRVMCVIKADGYGHGAVVLGKTLENAGCDAFGVATLDEGIELRRAGITSFILVLNHVSPDRIEEALERNLTMTVYTHEMAEAIDRCSGQMYPDKKTNVHIKFDTGMTRVGFNAIEAVDVLKQINSHKNICIEGVFAHFSSADEVDRTYTNNQIARLNAIFSEAQRMGVDIKIKHAANSAGAINYPESRLDMVRVGISLYGCYPSEDVDKSLVDLKPAMQVKTQVYRLNEVEAGTSVSYGRLFTATRKSRLATLPIGYADGLSRVMAGKLKVLVNGQFAPVVGKICMDQCIIDITDITGDVKIFDEVVIYGEQNGTVSPVENVANAMGTINYEILCMTKRRVPRYYFVDGEIVAMENFLQRTGTQYR